MFCYHLFCEEKQKTEKKNKDSRYIDKVQIPRKYNALYYRPTSSRRMFLQRFSIHLLGLYQISLACNRRASIQYRSNILKLLTHRFQENGIKLFKDLFKRKKSKRNGKVADRADIEIRVLDEEGHAIKAESPEENENYQFPLLVLPKEDVQRPHYLDYEEDFALEEEITSNLFRVKSSRGCPPPMEISDTQKPIESSALQDYNRIVDTMKAVICREMERQEKAVDQVREDELSGTNVTTIAEIHRTNDTAQSSAPLSPTRTSDTRTRRGSCCEKKLRNRPKYKIRISKIKGWDNERKKSKQTRQPSCRRRHSKRIIQQTSDDDKQNVHFSNSLKVSQV